MTHPSNDKARKLCRRLLACLLVLALACTGLHANEVRQLTIRDGLSNSAINCIYQDSCGLLWFGTWDGLNQYNSRDIRVFKPDVDFSRRNISNNIIRHIVEERKGILWISTDYGINRYDASADEFRSFFCTNVGKGVFKEHSFFIDKDSRGHIFALVSEYGLYVYDERQSDFVRMELNIDFTVKQMFLGAGDTLWLCADDGTLHAVALDYADPAGPRAAGMKQVAAWLRVDKVFYNPVRDEVWLQTAGREVYRSPASRDGFRKAAMQVAEKITAMAFKDSCCYVGTLQRLYRWEANRPEVLLDNLPINSLHLGEQDDFRATVCHGIVHQQAAVSVQTGIDVVPFLFVETLDGLRLSFPAFPAFAVFAFRLQPPQGFLYLSAAVVELFACAYLVYLHLGKVIVRAV